MEGASRQDRKLMRDAAIGALAAVVLAGAGFIKLVRDELNGAQRPTLGPEVPTTTESTAEIGTALVSYSLACEKSGERVLDTFEAELLGAAKIVIDTDERTALANLYGLVEGFAGHLSKGMVSAGFPEDEALIQGWQTAWAKLRGVVNEESGWLTEIASYLDRNIGEINPAGRISEAGEPLDPATRTFYRVFIDRIEHPAVHPTAAWIHEAI